MYDVRRYGVAKGKNGPAIIKYGVAMGRRGAAKVCAGMPGWV